MQSFHTLDVFGVISSRLLKDIDGFCGVLAFFIGGRPLTHEIPDFIAQFGPIIAAQIPESEKYIRIVKDFCEKGKVGDICERLVEIFGESITLTK